MWRELDGLMKPGQYCWTYVCKSSKPPDEKVYHSGMVFKIKPPASGLDKILKS
jgi:hypothetical protein